MAIYHLHVQVIGRSAGRSVTAAAAYRSASKITSDYTGLTFDFTGKKWVEYSEVMLPPHAPKEYHDREKLWNAADAAEKSRDAQVARELDVALPVELTLDQQIQLVKDFVKETFVAEGMIADINLHNPPVMDSLHRPVDDEGKPTRDVSKMTYPNPHAHIMLTLRPMDDQGHWQAKTQKEYLCRRGKEEKGFTAAEFASAREDGWQKQYKYKWGKKTVWLTEEEAGSRGLEKASRDPKTTRFGRRNPQIERWNSQEFVNEFRKAWEDKVNLHLRMAGIDAHVDSRSFADQGVQDQEPQIHVGSASIHMEDRFHGYISDRARINREIKDLEWQARKLRQNYEKAGINDIPRTYASMVRLAYKLKKEEAEYQDLLQKVKAEKEGLTELETLEKEIRLADAASEKHLQELNEALNNVSPLRFAEKEELNDDMIAEKERMMIRKEHLKRILNEHGLRNIKDISSRQRFIKDLEEEADEMEEKISVGRDEIERLVRELRIKLDIYTDTGGTMEQLQEEIKEAVEEERKQEEMEDADTFDDVVFVEVQVELDISLGLDFDEGLRLGEKAVYLAKRTYNKVKEESDPHRSRRR